MSPSVVPAPDPGELRRAVERVVAAGDTGTHAVLAALEAGLLAVGDPAVLLRRTDDGWVAASAAALTLLAPEAPPLPDADPEQLTLMPDLGALGLTGDLAAVVPSATVVLLANAATADAAHTLALVAHQTLAARQLARESRASGSEIRAMRTVAARLLDAVDREEGLLAVTHEAMKLLQADMAGILLRDGDEIAMRACTGNRELTTARLRMRRGQGLAGLVFSTGQAAKVDDYLHNDVISPDFHSLAVAERTRSALGAPLTIDGEVIGVLEVWRRRESVFSAEETERLVGLADLAAIALTHAQLYDEREASLHEVEVAHRLLETQFRKVTHALTMQQELVQALLDGERLSGVLRLVAQRTSTAVALFDADLDLLAAYPPNLDEAALAAAIRGVIGRGEPSSAATTWTDFDQQSLAVRPVFVAGDFLGWLGLLTPAAGGDEAVELALTQASLTCALHHLGEQAAARARAALRDEVLMSLLQGSADERRAAASRAKHVNIDLRGDLRACVCTFDRITEIGEAEGWSAGHGERVRRRLLAVCESALQQAGLLRLAARTGDAVIALIRASEPEELREILQTLADELAKEVPGLGARWGVSAARANPLELAEAYTEACTATRALGHASGRRVALHEELGILGLLLAGPGNPDLPRFVTDTIGPALDYDRVHGTMLIDTLRTYLDADCSQQETATRLFIHQKTVKYRLSQLQKLTGLDLRHHHDRMRADIAVRAADLD